MSEIQNVFAEVFICPGTMDLLQKSLRETHFGATATCFEFPWQIPRNPGIPGWQTGFNQPQPRPGLFFEGGVGRPDGARLRQGPSGFPLASHGCQGCFLDSRNLSGIARKPGENYGSRVDYLESKSGFFRFAPGAL